jgi:hypothetical protein
MKAAMIVRSLVLAVLLLGGLAMSSAQSREDYLKAYEARAHDIRSSFDTSNAVSYYAVAARYASNNGVAIADSLFQVALREPRGDMFWMFPVI